MSHLYTNFPPGQSSSAATPLFESVFSASLWTKFYNVGPYPSIAGPGSSDWGSQIGSPNPYNTISFTNYDARVPISENFGSVSKGLIYSATPTVVTFVVVSDNNGIALLFNGTTIISSWNPVSGNDGYSSSSVTLPAGYTPLELRLFHRYDYGSWYLMWDIGSIGYYQVTSYGRMFHTAADLV